MIKRLLYKWFGISDPPCETCEVLREQLASSERERRELLNRLLEPVKSEPLVEKMPEFKPITPNFVPWRVKQQMLEAEDRERARLMRDKTKEIADLEKELGVGDASQKSASV